MRWPAHLEVRFFDLYVVSDQDVPPQWDVSITSRCWPRTRRMLAEFRRTEFNLKAKNTLKHQKVDWGLISNLVIVLSAVNLRTAEWSVWKSASQWTFAMVYFYHLRQFTWRWYFHLEREWLGWIGALRRFRAPIYTQSDHCVTGGNWLSIMLLLSHKRHAVLLGKCSAALFSREFQRIVMPLIASHLLEDCDKGKRKRSVERSDLSSKHFAPTVVTWGSWECRLSRWIWIRFTTRWKHVSLLPAAFINTVRCTGVLRGSFAWPNCHRPFMQGALNFCCIKISVVLWKGQKYRASKFFICEKRRVPSSRLPYLLPEALWWRVYSNTPLSSAEIALFALCMHGSSRILPGYEKAKLHAYFDSIKFWRINWCSKK